MDLSILMGGGKYLKRLNQSATSTVWSGTTLPGNTWVEALSLTGKHLIDMVAVGGDNSVDCHTKYVVDGVESTERVIQDQKEMLIIGFGNNSTTEDIYIDGPQYCKESFKVFVKRATGASFGMSMKARYSQVTVESME